MPVEAKPMPAMLRIFASRNYALYFGGQLISQVGTWMQTVALSWFTYTLTQSPMLLALVGVSTQLPSLLLMPFAGVIADRFDKHRIIVITQTLSMIQAFILAYLTMTNQVQIWHLIALGIFAGVITAFDMPTRSAFVVSLVDKKEDLPNAIAMNSSLMNTTRLIGPALAGFIVAALGAGMCFLINAISYVAVIVALLFVKVRSELKHASDKGVFEELKEGFAYAWNTVPVRAFIAMLAIFNIGGMAYSLLLPVFVKHIGGNANTLGYLMSASAVGSLAATLALASRKNVVGLGRWVVRSSFVFSGALIAFSFVHQFWTAMVVLAVMGATIMVLMASINTILQAVIEHDKRGRVMSLFTMAFMGTAPLGSLIGGAITDRFGFSVTMLVCGIYCLLVSLVFSIATQSPLAYAVLSIREGIDGFRARAAVLAAV